jgi:hypothetical protein
MLNVRRAVSGCRGKKRSVLLGDEGGKLGRDLVGKAFGDAPLIRLCRAAFCLGFFCRRYENQIGDVHGLTGYAQSAVTEAE